MTADYQTDDKKFWKVGRGPGGRAEQPLIVLHCRSGTSSGPVPRMIFLVTLALLAGLAPALRAQDLLRLAEGQLAIGLAVDARLLVERALETEQDPPSRQRALYYQALLTFDADSARDRLARVASSGGAAGWGEAAAALERLGDLYFSRAAYGEAAGRWLLAAESCRAAADCQRLLVKTARAQLRAGLRQDALSSLRRAAELGESPSLGMVHYWRAVAREAVGDLEGAGRDYLVAYQRPGDPCQLAALHRLAAIWGRGDSRNAIEWRERWSKTRPGTVFAGVELPTEKARPATGAAGRPSAAVEGFPALQLGAFSRRASAEKLQRRAKQLGLTAEILPPGPDGLLRVQIRNIKSQKQLDQVAAVLNQHRIEYRRISP